LDTSAQWLILPIWLSEKIWGKLEVKPLKVRERVPLHLDFIARADPDFDLIIFNDPYEFH